MEVEYSEKYDILFNLLDNSFEPKVDTVLLYGGRDSAKSHAESSFITLASADYGHRILYTRYTMNTTDNSISTALNNRIEMFGYENKFEFANNLYTCENGGKIFITGQKTSSLNQTAKLKSLEDFSIFVTDEAEEIRTFDEWDKICKSIRAKDVRCLNMLVFNPPTREHWIYTELFESRGVDEGFTGIKDNILYIHTTYEDNIENIAEHNLRDYLKLKKSYDFYSSLKNNEKDKATPKVKKEYRRYKHVVLGGFLDVGEGVIYEDWKIGEFDNSLPYCYGLDFGFNDPNALVKVAVDENKNKIYLQECYFKNGVGTETLFKVLSEIVGFTDLIVGDSAAKTLIFDLYDKGLNIVKCPRKDVKQRIKTIQGFEIIITDDSTNLKKALKNYCWHDKRSNTPNHNWSDLCDAFGYGVMELLLYH